MNRSDLLIERAKQETGLDHFGADSFREGLERLIASADSQAKLTEAGKAMFDADVVKHLSKRLEIEHWYQIHPEIDEQTIAAPLFGLGLPRTGSTVFHCMLAEDPNVRFIRSWEAQAPCPPPETATQHNDPRIEQDRERLAIMDQLFPRLKTMLPLSPTAPMECQYFMGYDFKSLLFPATYQLPDYSSWLLHQADMVPTFEYLKRVLKLLQWRCPPGNWRLKNPALCIFIDDLNTVFPDAKFWVTHRDIGQVIPSIVDMYYEFISAGSDAVDLNFINELNQESWELGLRRLITFRDKDQNDQRFFDAQFMDVQKNPIPVFEKLYEFLGEDFTDQTRTNMLAWREDTPREKHGAREYKADISFDLDQLRKRFAFYNDRFDIKI